MIYFHYIFRKYTNQYVLRNLKWKNSSRLNDIINDKKQDFNYVSYHAWMRG